MKYLKICLAVFLSVSAAVLFAAGQPVANIFTSGTTAVAADVNANFQELADRIADNPVADVYDFKDYSPASDITQKTFDMTNSTCGDTETRNFTRSPVSGGTEITVLRTRTNSGVACQIRDTVFLSTDTKFTRVTRNHYNAGDSSLLLTRDYADPIEIRNSTMRIGQPIVSFSQVDITGSVTATDHILYEFMIVAVEDVTVPADTYTGCLKTLTTYTGGPNLFNQKFVAWYCPDVGLVKIVENNPALDTRDTFTIRELANITR